MTKTAGLRRGWQAVAIALAAVAFGLALAGIRGGLATAHDSAQASRTVTVGIDRFAYQPATLRVGAGTKVVFANNSGLPHTATRKGSFTTGRIKPGKATSIRFGHQGTYAYHCTIHPFMRGKVIVD